MLTFLEWMESVGLKFPADCSNRSIARKASSGHCYTEPGGGHDKVRDTVSKKVVAIVPRHNHLNTDTCRSIIKKIEDGC